MQDVIELTKQIMNEAQELSEENTNVMGVALIVAIAKLTDTLEKRLSSINHMMIYL